MPWRRIISLVRSYPSTALVLVVGLALRALLVPLTHGQDFAVWDLAARYTLAGVNIYRDHPPYPGGPYAYVPLFLYVELPLRWLALRAGLSFTVLGKLPIVAGDLLTTALIARILARSGRGCRDWVVALGAALYFLNPLVLYNGAFYGRFDTLCAGLLLLALVAHDRRPSVVHAHRTPQAPAGGWQSSLPGAPAASRQRPPDLLGAPAASRQRPRLRRLLGATRSPATVCRLEAGAPGGHDASGPRGAPSGHGASDTGDDPGWRVDPGGHGWAFPLLYALAIAMKSYPVFLLPWLLAREPHGRGRLLLALAGVLGGLSLPYLLTSPARFVADILLYDGHKTPGHLSWQVMLLGVLSPHAARLVSYLLLLLFVPALYLCRRLDLWTYCAVSILLFILLSKVVIEQYFLWPLPFLILDALRNRSRAAGGLLLLLSAIGMLVNPYIHPFGESPWPVAAILAASILLYLAAVHARGRRAAVAV